MALIDAIWPFSDLPENLPIYQSLAAHYPTLYPNRSACGIGFASEKYLKWQALQLAIYSAVAPLIDSK